MQTPMSNPVERVEINSGIHRHRRNTAKEKVRLVEQTMKPGKQQRLRGLRRNPETRLCPRESKARRDFDPSAATSLVRRLQQYPPAFGLTHAFAA